MSERTSLSFSISNDIRYCKSYHLAMWLSKTKSPNFGATYSKNTHGVVKLLTRWTTSFGSPTLISPTGTVWKHLRAIKLSLVGSTSLLQSSNIWKPQLGHLALIQSRFNHFCLGLFGHKVFSHRSEALSNVWEIAWQVTIPYWKVPVAGFAQSDMHPHVGHDEHWKHAYCWTLLWFLPFFGGTCSNNYWNHATFSQNKASVCRKKSININIKVHNLEFGVKV
jgi:hypothetical protein